MKKYWLALVVVVAAALVAYAWRPEEAHTNVMQTVTVGAAVFTVEVADTDRSRELGLGGRASLWPGRGMLFVFDQPAAWGIWMKDMHFAIDIVWARADGTVTTVARNVASSTYPKVFYPKAPDIQYVLEVSAGAAADIAEGATILIDKK